MKPREPLQEQDKLRHFSNPLYNPANEMLNDKTKIEPRLQKHIKKLAKIRKIPTSYNR